MRWALRPLSPFGNADVIWRPYKPGLEEVRDRKVATSNYPFVAWSAWKARPSINGEWSNGVSPRKYLTVAELFTLYNQPSPLPLFIRSKFSVSASLLTFSNGPNTSSGLLRTAEPSRPFCILIS
jgi:hypothetical protein